ncbi:MAG: hypothetical protein FJW79_07375 [Actinobacteria bacterium]|nr:hypothetical protein [Actinomycetota bacterium]
MRRVLIPLFSLLLLAAACGGDGGAFSSTTTTEAPTTSEAPTTTEAPTSTGAPTTTEMPTTTEAPTTTGGGAINSPEELIDFIAGEVAGGDGPYDDESARCFAEGVVDDVGYDRLVDLGATTANADPEEVFAGMTDAEVGIVADVALGCLDMHALFVQQFTSQGLPQAAAVCIADGVAGAPFVHEMVVAGLLGQPFDPMTDPEASALILGLVTQCMSG